MVAVARLEFRADGRVRFFRNGVVRRQQPAASARERSIDPLGVSACDVAVIGDEVRMLYTATDGTVPQLAQTTRPRMPE
jgi:hypothetical protein